MLTGYQANNPGNIRRTPINWKGKVKNSNNPFEIFTSLAFGTRALFMQIRTDLNRGNNTIEKLISKYAPATENQTNKYITNVARFTGFLPNQILKPTKANLYKLAAAISKQETGTALTNSELNKGFSLLDKQPDSIKFLPLLALAGIAIFLIQK
jgi:hypothetical protein